MTEHQSPHHDVDRAEFDRRVRASMNSGVETAGHQPLGEYTPAAWRHYVRRLALLDRMRSLSFTSALDVGCAEGYFMDVIGRAHGAEMWGVDLSDAAVRAVKTRYGFSAAAAQVTALPFPDGAFDLVYATEVIEHILEPEVMLAEMRRVARRHVLITTPVSQSADEHAPDYDVDEEGHVNNFDLPTVRQLFGATADVRSFRNNSTFALLTALGRHLPAGARDGFYRLDLEVAKRWGTPHHRQKALRNRDWMIVCEAAPGPMNPAELRCPRCHGALTEAEDAMRCDADGLTFPLVAPGSPDFTSERGEAGAAAPAGVAGPQPQ